MLPRMHWSGGGQGHYHIRHALRRKNAILLPGRIPGYKRDDIKLLPSSCTKRAVWLLYQESATSLTLRSVAYTTFCKVWRNFMGGVVVCKPMTDLCETCQRNSAAIVRSFNKSEEGKSEV